jgi:hypothetical protein
MKALRKSHPNEASLTKAVILNLLREPFAAARTCAEATAEHLDYSVLAFQWHVTTTPEVITLSDPKYVGVARGAPVDYQVVSCFGELLKSRFVDKRKWLPFVPYDGLFVYNFTIGHVPSEPTEVTALQR